MSRGFRQLDLRTSFLPLMDRDAALGLVDAAAAEIEHMMEGERAKGHDPLSYAFLDQDAVDMERIELVWPAAASRLHAECSERVRWLRELRRGIEETF